MLDPAGLGFHVAHVGHGLVHASEHRGLGWPERTSKIPPAMLLIKVASLLTLVCLCNKVRSLSANVKAIKLSIQIILHVSQENTMFDSRNYTRLLPLDEKFFTEAEDLLGNGVTEWHTHWHGILNAKEYIDAMLIFVFSTNDETVHIKRCKIAHSYICMHDEDVEWPTDLKHLVKWVKDATSNESVVKRIEHVLSSRHCDEKPEVNWNWAYIIRSIIRDGVRNQLNRQEDFVKIPVLKWTREGDGLNFLKGSMAIKRQIHDDITLSISDICSKKKDIRSAILRNIEEFVNAIHEQGPSYAGPDVHISKNVVDYLYARRIRTALQCPNNGATCCEIDGKHLLDPDLIENLCGDEIISAPSLPKMEIRFLYGLSTELLNSGNLESLEKRKEEVVNMIRRHDYIGTDFRGPEAKFSQESCDVVLKGLAKVLMSVVPYRLDKEYNTPVVMRIHVGESNMLSNFHDPKLEEIGRENIEKVLNALEKITFDKDRVVARLGHVTALTLGQAIRMRRMGIACEINSISNMRTYASSNYGSLPIIKLYVADALYRYEAHLNKNIYQETRFKFMSFTCNTDGGGVMHSDLLNEYALDLMLVDEFSKPDVPYHDGSSPRIPVFPSDKDFLSRYVNGYSNLHTSHGPDFSIRGRKYMTFWDLKDEIKNFLRKDNFISSAQPRQRRVV